MPDLEDVISASSTETPAPAPAPDASQAPDATPAAPSSGTDVTPDPSSGKTDAEHKDLLSAISTAAGATEDEEPFVPEAKPDASAPPSKEGSEPKAPEQPAEPTPEEMRQYSPRAQERIRELIAKSKTIQADLEAARPAADGYVQIQSYMQTHGLSTEDFQLLLGTGALLRAGDFQTFLEVVRPYIQAAEEASGARLPPDLQRDVDDGLMPEDRAVELSLSRFRTARAETAYQETETARTQDWMNQHQVAVSAAVRGWEDQAKREDPDFERKRPLLEDAVFRMVGDRGVPQSPAQAVQYAQEAYNRVSQTLGQNTLRPTRPQPSAGGHSAVPVAPEPKSLMEAVTLGLQRAAG